MNPLGATARALARVAARRAASTTATSAGVGRFVVHRFVRPRADQITIENLRLSDIAALAELIVRLGSAIGNGAPTVVWREDQGRSSRQT